MHGYSAPLDTHLFHSNLCVALGVAVGRCPYCDTPGHDEEDPDDEDERFYDGLCAKGACDPQIA